MKKQKNKNSEKSLKKFVDFPAYFIKFVYYWFVFLYRKDTNSILKYLIFFKTLQKIYKTKKIFCVSCIRLSLSKIRKIIASYFHTTKKIILFFLYIKHKKKFKKRF